MPQIQYIIKRFGAETLRIIEIANQICADYRAQGYDLTLRQLYYQFVARGYIPNRDTEYKRLGSIINDARLAGLMDWDHIVDRTRNLRSLATWGSPGEIMRAVADQYRTDRWDYPGQEYRLEVWVEKDALVGVIARVCDELHVPYFSCRGYTSQSEVWSAGQRLKAYIENGKWVVIIHLGDHDPSGIDMSRDIEDRLKLFVGEMDSASLRINRIALNWDQVRLYNPPPNPAKLTDSRVDGYIRRFGNDSWELDALEPAVIEDLIRNEILVYRDQEAWDKATAEDEKDQAVLQAIGFDWYAVERFIESRKGDQ